MDEIIKLQDEILSYLRDNITKDEAYYILTTDKEMIEVLISDKKDGSKRINILDMEYTIEKDARNWWIRSQNTVPRYLPVNLSS